MEIWNLVFIQLNADPDGGFSPLPARHVDTGMGFERVAGIIECTDGFRDFKRAISNYESDVFRPIFQKISALSGKSYGRTLPGSRANLSEQEKIDVAFRVVADHIRTLSLGYRGWNRSGQHRSQLCPQAHPSPGGAVWSLSRFRFRRDFLAN